LQTYIRHLSGHCVVRADMESANCEAPIVTSGCTTEVEWAGRVIGDERSGSDPGCHDGRSTQAQAV